MSNPILLHTQANIDFVGDYKYPAAAKVFEIGNEDVKIHVIFMITSVASILTATDGTGFGYAPKESVIFESVSGACRIYQKNSAGTFLYLLANS